jgi:hypothetical protein
LAEDPEWRATLGARARQYAEATFDIEKIADRFEAVLTKAARCQAEAVGHGGLFTAVRRWLWLSD